MQQLHDSRPEQEPSFNRPLCTGVTPFISSFCIGQVCCPGLYQHYTGLNVLVLICLVLMCVSCEIRGLKRRFILSSFSPPYSILILVYCSLVLLFSPCVFLVAAQLALLAKMSHFPRSSSDRSFGPTLSGSFDFTLSFENWFLFTAPSAILILATPLYAIHYLHQPVQCLAGWLLWAKLVSWG